MTARRALGSLLALGLALLAGLSVVPAAQAAGPPVTAPDAGTVFQGNFAAIFPVKNDHDPDNDLLTICRIGTEHYKGLEVGFLGDEFDVLATPKAKPGTYTFTYYVCDFSTLVPGTITVTVAPLPKVKVKAIKSRPGKIRVTNPADFKIRFLYGSFKEDRPDGKVLIAKGASVVIPVHRTTIEWVAFNRKGDIFLGQGKVTGIKLSRATARPGGRVTLSHRLAQAWRAA